jgi:hypothetical protein
MIVCGDAATWWGEADAVFTQPYGPIPSCLHKKPMILNVYGSESRVKETERWIGGQTLKLLGAWGEAHRNRVYVVNLPALAVSIDDLREDGSLRCGGPFPLDLPRRLLRAYREFFTPGMMVWDGFCGRGTVGRVCREFKLNYIGIDIDPETVRMAREYVYGN